MDQEEIGRRLDVIKKRYGTGISDPMYQMLHPNPALRPAAKELKLVWDKSTEPALDVLPPPPVVVTTVV